MAYTIRIGEQVMIDENDAEVPPYPGVEEEVRKDSPFGRVENEFSVTYAAWKSFCERTGLERLFLNEEVGLLREHPGCVALEFEHVAVLEGAIEIWKEGFPDAKPGFGAGEDSDLATMIWLAYWMHRSLEDCVDPAVQNR